MIVKFLKRLWSITSKLFIGVISSALYMMSLLLVLAAFNPDKAEEVLEVFGIQVERSLTINFGGLE